MTACLPTPLPPDALRLILRAYWNGSGAGLARDLYITKQMVHHWITGRTKCQGHYVLAIERLLFDKPRAALTLDDLVPVGSSPPKKLSHLLSALNGLNQLSAAITADD